MSRRNTPIVVVDYDPKWKTDFEQLESRLKGAIGKPYPAIQHVGSTSVVGLAAKPIIDLDIIVNSLEEMKMVISKLQAFGYEHLGDLGIPNREAFKRASPNGTAPEDLIEHNLYVCLLGAPSLENHLLLRDYLRQNPAIAQEYSALKKRLAKEFRNNRDAYTVGKTEFIVNILKIAGIHSAEIDSIRDQNMN